MARDVRPGRCRAGLEPLLGADGCAGLEAVMLRRTVAWAEAAAPGRVLVAHAENEEVGAAVPGAELVVAPDARAAAALAAERFDPPLLVVLPAVPRLGPAHAATALLDLRDGADASFGPLHSGGWYLAALARPRPELLPDAAEPGEGEPLLARTLGAAARLGLEVGLLRMERGLDSLEDARALLADPLLPADVRAALDPAHPNRTGGGTD